MSYEVHLGDIGETPNDAGPKLIASHRVFTGTRAECWAELDRLEAAHPDETWLVRKPDMSDGAGGYPTMWDDRP